MRITLLCLILSSFGWFLPAQNCPRFDESMRKGKRLLASRNYDKALIEFQTAQVAARQCDLDVRKSKEPSDYIQRVFSGLQQQRDNAQRAEKKAADALAEAEALNRKNERLINAFYFYDGKYALGMQKDQYGNTKYGYFDKEGNTQIDYKYLEALPFESNGFARVYRNNKKFLIDTTGREYPLAENLDEINSRTRAVDLRGQNLKGKSLEMLKKGPIKILLLARTELTSFPSEILDLQELELLDMNGNFFKEVPGGIGALTQLRWLNLNWCILSALPKEISQLKNLVYLNLGSNQFETFPEEILAFVKLKKLDLGACKIAGLPSEIGRLKLLEFLDLSQNQLFSLPVEMGQLAQLEELNISSSNYASLPEPIKDLKRLKRLNLSFNQLTSLPEWIGQLKQLQDLNLLGNKLDGLPAQIGELVNLEEMDMQRNQLKTLPPEIGRLTKLKALNLRNNLINSLPVEVNQMDELLWVDLNINKTLDLKAIFSVLSKVPKKLRINYSEGGRRNTDNRILGVYFPDLKELPAEVGLLEQTEVLILNARLGEIHQRDDVDLTTNGIPTLPSSIGKLTAVRHISFQGNGLRALPAEIGRLRNLETAILDYNLIKELPAQMMRLTKLKELILNKNQLTKLPQGIGQLKSLQKLEIGQNQLTDLPADFSTLTQLKTLLLYNNQLSQLPEQITSLAQLEHLVLSGNPMNSLPSTIGKLKSLKRLSLSSTQLKEIPSSIGQLAQLNVLDLGYSEIQHVPKELGQLTALHEIILTANDSLSLKEVCLAFADFPKRITITTQRWGAYPDMSELVIKIPKPDEIPPEMGSIKNLKKLELKGTKFSEEEKERIEKMLPDCEITY